MDEKDVNQAAEDNSVMTLTQDEIDTIGEILNISMGSAATAMSALLDKQVIITPPAVTQKVMNSLDYKELEPAILVKIQYIEGLTGNNVMLFRQHDIQVILNLLMGTDDEPRDDFEFDDISMSAACEVMNQMMGASATALSEVLGKTINISTPDAFVIADQPLDEFVGTSEGNQVIAVSFGLVIKDVMNTSFASIIPSDFAQMIIDQVLGDQAKVLESIPEAQKPPAPVPAASAESSQPQQSAANSAPTPPSPPPAMPPIPPAANPVQQAPSPMPQTPPAVPQPAPVPQMPMTNEANPYYPYPPAGYPGMPQYPYYPPYNNMQPNMQPMPPMSAPAAPDYQSAGVIRQPMDVKTAQFPDFTQQGGMGSSGAMNASMELLMNVPLNVTVEIGKTKRKIKDIMEFGQGTVVELEKQAGAPVDIVVNGQLIARGDVVVIEDNFGVRITEILGTENLVNSLGKAK